MTPDRPRMTGLNIWLLNKPQMTNYYGARNFERLSVLQPSTCFSMNPLMREDKGFPNSLAGSFPRALCFKRACFGPHKMVPSQFPFLTLYSTSIQARLGGNFICFETFSRYAVKSITCTGSKYFFVLFLAFLRKSIKTAYPSKRPRIPWD